jgi:hypothetical protein
MSLATTLRGIFLSFTGQHFVHLKDLIRAMAWSATGGKDMVFVDVVLLTNLAADYANGTAGVGATLTKASAGAFPTTDDIPATPDLRVFLAGQTDPAQNGPYRLNRVGDSSSIAFQLTRVTGFDQSAEMVPGTKIAVRKGTAGVGKVYAYTGAASPTVGATALTFAEDPLLSAASAAVISGVTQFAQDALQVLNSGGTFATKFRSLATATRTATLPDGSLTIAGVNLAQAWSALQTFAQDMLKVNNTGGTFGTLFRSLATATRTVTLPDADFTPAQAGIVSDATAPTFTGTAATAAVAAAVESGTGLTAAGQVLTSTDNKTATLNQYANHWLISAANGPYLIVSNTAVTGAPLVLTVIGGPATTDAGIYQIHAAPTPAGTVASHTHEQN